MKNLAFKPLPEHKRGIIVGLLRSCHEGYLKFYPNYFEIREKNWKAYDNEVFDNPKTVGACGFISYAGPNIVGFASFGNSRSPFTGYSPKP